MKKKEVLLIISNHKGVYSLEESTTHKLVETEETTLMIKLSTNGFTKIFHVIQVAEKVTKKNKQKETKVQSFAESSYLSVKHPNNIHLLNIRVDIPAISFCLISDTHEEVLHAWLEKILLDVQQGTLELDISGQLKRVQIDNQILNTPFSNILSTSNKDPNSNFLR